MTSTYSIAQINNVIVVALTCASTSMPWVFESENSPAQWKRQTPHILDCSCFAGHAESPSTPRILIGCKLNFSTFISLGFGPARINPEREPNVHAPNPSPVVREPQILSPKDLNLKTYTPNLKP